MTIKIHPNLISFVKPDAHSKFSPSSAERWWGGCSYSIGASVGIVEEEESKYATEGTTAHSVCEALFRQHKLDLPFPNELSFEMVNGTSDNGDEMMQAAQDYYDVCEYWLNNKEKIGEILWFGQERGIPIFPEKSCYGTGDFIIVGSKGGAVIDFKYGRKPVSADSKQLKAYASGIARHIDNAPKDYGIYAVVFQPRVAVPVKEIYYPIAELYKSLTSIWESLLMAERNDLEPVEGSHCFWCPARRTKDVDKRCKLMVEKPLKLANERFDMFLANSNITPDTSDKKVLRDEAIIKLLTLKPAIDEVLKQCKEDFLLRIEAGEHIPGVTVKSKLGNRVISAEDDKDGADKITDMFPDIDPWRIIPAVKKLRTLSDMEKEVGKNNLDPICTRKVSKEVEVLDEKQQSILSTMVNFARNISKS